MINETQTRLKELAEYVKAATVAIGVQHPPEGPVQRPFTIHGAGFCIHNQGVIATSKHVLDEFIDPNNVPPSVIFFHPNMPNNPQLHINIEPVRKSSGLIKPGAEEALDLVLLKIDPPSAAYSTGYPTLSIADHGEIYELMDVVTCGFPLGTFMMEKVGNLTSSFSRGIVSSIIPWSNAPIDQLEGFQLDIRVAPGNSGGPVVSLSSGRVFAALKGGIERNGIQFQARGVPVITLPKSGLIEGML